MRIRAADADEKLGNNCVNQLLNRPVAMPGDNDWLWWNDQTGIGGPSWGHSVCRTGGMHQTTGSSKIEDRSDDGDVVLFTILDSQSTAR
jgi:hypothetical protein